MAKFFAVCLFLFCQVLWAIPVRDGFLGLSIAVVGQLGESKIDSAVSKKNQVRLPVVFSGAAEEYDLFFEATLISDITQIGNYYSHDREFLEDNQVYSFTFLDSFLMYRLFQYKNISLLGGFGLGHRGYMAKNFTELTYTIYAAPVASAFWFISKKFALRYQVAWLFGLYRKNLNSHIHIGNKLEFIFDPIGPVENPSPESAYYSIGVNLDLGKFETKAAQSVTFTHIQPFAKFTLLY